MDRSITFFYPSCLESRPLVVAETLHNFLTVNRCFAKYKASNCCKIEVVIQRISVKKVFLNIFQNLKENPCPRVSFLIKLQLKKETLTQLFSCEFCNIFKNTFFYRTPTVAASCKTRTKSQKLAKFQFQLFLNALDIMGSLYM